MKRLRIVLPPKRSSLAVGLLAILVAVLAPLALLTGPVSAATFGDIDCADLPTAGTLEADETVDGNLTVSSGADCTIEGTVDGNIINNGGGDVALNGSLDGNIELEGDGGSASGDGDINGNIVCKGTGTTSAHTGVVDGNVECPGPV